MKAAAELTRAFEPTRCCSVWKRSGAGWSEGWQAHQRGDVVLRARRLERGTEDHSIADGSQVGADEAETERAAHDTRTMIGSFLRLLAWRFVAMMVLLAIRHGLRRRGNAACRGKGSRNA